MINKNDFYDDATALSTDKVKVIIEHKNNIHKIVLQMPFQDKNIHELDQIIYINNYLGQEIDIKIIQIDNILLAEQQIYNYQQLQIHKKRIQNMIKIFENSILQLKNLLIDLEQNGDEYIDQKLDKIILYNQKFQLN